MKLHAAGTLNQTVHHNGWFCRPERDQPPHAAGTLSPAVRTAGGLAREGRVQLLALAATNLLGGVLVVGHNVPRQACPGAHGSRQGQLFFLSRLFFHRRGGRRRHCGSGPRTSRGEGTRRRRQRDRGVSTSGGGDPSRSRGGLLFFHRLFFHQRGGRRRHSDSGASTSHGKGPFGLFLFFRRRGDRRRRGGHRG